MKRLLLISAFLLCAAPASATISHVGGTSGASGASSFTLSYTATAGNTLILWVDWDSTSGTITASDTHNTYTTCTGFPFNGVAWSVTCFTAVNIGTGGALTITISGTPSGAGNGGATLDEFSGVGSTITFNGHATHDSSSGTQTTTPTTGTYSAGSSGDLAIAEFGSDNTTTGTRTAGSGFTAAQNANVGSFGIVFSEFQTTAANTTASMTNTVTGNWIGGVVSIKQPSAGGAATGFNKQRRYEELDLFP